MQILEREKKFGPRVSYQRIGSSSSSSPPCALPFPFLLIDSFSRKSFSYNKLPQEPLNLTVIKLDGSSFDIEVRKTATVAELKQAVEAAFSHLPKKGPGRVSWSHVWGQFCLCYDGQKLLNDSDYIGSYGIKEGDKLHFIRHTSIYYNLVKTGSGKEDFDLEQPRISSCIRDAYEERENKDGDVYCSEQENLRQDKDNDENDSVTMDYENRLAGLVRGWFSYRRLTTSETSCEESSSSNSSRSNSGFFGSFKNLARLYSSKDNSQMETWKGE